MLCFVCDYFGNFFENIQNRMGNNNICDIIRDFCWNVTAVETVVDLVTEEYNEKAKIAKDVAAGAVLISAINSVAMGLIIFMDKILEMIF